MRGDEEEDDDDGLDEDYDAEIEICGFCGRPFVPTADGECRTCWNEYHDD